jgi:CspA family cold shock protein
MAAGKGEKESDKNYHEEIFSDFISSLASVRTDWRTICKAEIQQEEIQKQESGNKAIMTQDSATNDVAQDECSIVVENAASTKVEHSDPNLWKWIPSGQKAKDMDEWISQAKLAENKEHAIASINDGHLAKWLYSIGDYEKYRLAIRKNDILEQITPEYSSDSKTQNNQRERGCVKWFNDGKGYGFIKRASGEDLFVHQTAIITAGPRTLKQEDSVEYSIIKTEKGYCAVGVRKIN